MTGSASPESAAAVGGGPARNRRPRNRRALISSAAAELFYRRGYPQVGMSDIAEAVGVGPSALYRHFESKQQLLTRVVLDELRPFTEIAGAAGEAGETVGALATAAVSHRQLGVLWQREARHLPADQRDLLKEELRSVATGLAALARTYHAGISDEDARFRGWCMFSVLTSLSYHQVDLARRDFEALLRAMVTVIGQQPPTTFTSASRAERALESLLASRSSRRRLLLAAATRLFADRGYAEVTIEDVGAAAGIAGPSVYNHFASKQELLSTVITRGSAWLEVELERTLAGTSDAREALSALLRSYTGFAFDHGRFIDILVTEVNHLPLSQRHRARQTQHSYVAEWVGLLCEVRPELDPLTARVLVQAAVTAANDMARTGTVRDVDALVGMGAALMFQTPAPDTGGVLMPGVSSA